MDDLIKILGENASEIGKKCKSILTSAYEEFTRNGRDHYMIICERDPTTMTTVSLLMNLGYLCSDWRFGVFEVYTLTKKGEEKYKELTKVNSRKEIETETSFVTFGKESF